MSVKYLRREVARSCPIHSVVLDKCSDALADFGVFEKKDIIDGLNFSAIEGAIRWDYISEFLAEDQGIELVPLAQRYFTRHPKAERAVAPEKFIAMGHGKKTMGYACVELEGGVFAVKRLQTKKALSNGVGKAVSAFGEALILKRSKLDKLSQSKLDSLTFE